MRLHLAEDPACHGFQVVDLFGKLRIGNAVVGIANGAQRAGIAFVRLLGRKVFLLGFFLCIALRGVRAAEQDAASAVHICLHAEHALFDHVFQIILDRPALPAGHDCQLVDRDGVALTDDRQITGDALGTPFHASARRQRHDAAGKKTDDRKNILPQGSGPAVADHFADHAEQSDAEDPRDSKPDDREDIRRCVCGGRGARHLPGGLDDLRLALFRCGDRRIALSRRVLELGDQRDQSDWPKTDGEKDRDPHPAAPVRVFFLVLHRAERIAFAVIPIFGAHCLVLAFRFASATLILFPFSSIT